MACAQRLLLHSQTLLPQEDHSFCFSVTENIPHLHPSLPDHHQTCTDLMAGQGFALPSLQVAVVELLTPSLILQSSQTVVYPVQPTGS